MYAHGLVGNCQAAALISPSGSVDWLCFPRPDSPPVFGRLLDPDGGDFTIEAAADAASTRQRYLPNTATLETTVETADGSAFRILDFFPRFHQHGRLFRPNALFRIVEPLRGTPQVRVRCRPVNGWEKEPAAAVRGNSHLRYDLRDESLRLTTNMSLTYLTEQQSFALQEKIYFALTWSFGVEEDLVETSERFLERTHDYWQTWVKHCSIPSLYQEEAIRSAITLKLHCYEDTGAILAALTTSLPEELGGERNWDYRFCWLRDAHYVLTAFHNLGQFEEMEGFLRFILGIAEDHAFESGHLSPVFRLDRSSPAPEMSHPAWSGYAGSTPVRSNNQASEHVQNDVYGEMALTLSPIFFDERFRHLRTREHEALLARFVRKAASSISVPDAGLWEIRNGWQVHSFSNLMSWAALERATRLRKLGRISALNSDDLDASLSRAEAAVRAAVVDGSLRNGPTDSSFDASLLHVAMLGFPDQTLARATIDQIQKALSFTDASGSSAFLYRYLRPDDFGRPGSAFLICSFWLVQALARIGENAKAGELLKQTLAAANPLGLFSEHYSPATRTQTGNFPQAYSHVGLLNAAFAVSPPWPHVL